MKGITTNDLHEITTSDLHAIADFHKIVKNYLKMKRIEAMTDIIVIEK